MPQKLLAVDLGTHSHRQRANEMNKSFLKNAPVEREFDPASWKIGIQTYPTCCGCSTRGPNNMSTFTVMSLREDNAVAQKD